MSIRDDYADVKKRGGVIDLMSRVKLSFTGNDRIRYLNGQVTAKLTGTIGIQPACVTTAKGKLCAEVFISTFPDAVMVDADALVAESLPVRLEKYIVADDVIIEDVTSRAALVHCAGISAAQIDGIAPAFASNRLGIPGVDLLVRSRADFGSIWEKLIARFPIITEELAELLRIEAGVPRWGYELDENTLPAEAGLDRTHVDFHKGCYIGQEVISRVKSVGHVNRGLHKFVSQNREIITAKSRITSVDAPEKDLGIITSAAFSSALGRTIALGFLRRGALESGLVATGPDGLNAPVPMDLRD